MNQWFLFLILLFAAGTMLTLFFIVSMRREGGKKGAAEIWGTYFSKAKNQARINMFLQKSYVRFERVPLLRRYAFKIRKRLELLNTYDEYAIRRETMKIAFNVLGFTALISLLLVLINRDWISIFWALLAAVVVNGILISTFVNRVEDRLLKNSVPFFEDVRQYFQDVKNVEEAIYEASQKAHPDVAKHGNRIYEALSSRDQQKALDDYYDVAPNRWFKMFAYVAYIIFEYGDRQVRNGSLFMTSVSKIISEVNYEIRRRDKLNYLLKGLSTIALIPVFFVKPLQNWATTYFPVMSEFYQSRTGLIILIIFYAVVLAAYIILRKMLENDEARYVSHSGRINWEKFLYEKTPIRFLVDRLKPKPFKRLHRELTLLIKQANSPLTIEWLYVQRIVISTVCFLLAVSLFLYIHVSATRYILYNPLQGLGIYGKLSERDYQNAKEITDFDRNVIFQLEQSKDSSLERTIEIVSRETGNAPGSKDVVAAAQRIFQKYNALKAEYFKWWELVIGILVSAAAYHWPVALLHIQRRIRRMEIQDELDQFYSVISILREFPRMDVETVLEWLERFAVIFKEPLRNCLNDYSSGPIQALEKMKTEAPFPDFERIVVRLQNSVERIPLKAAFDDLEMAQEHYRELRKEHHSRVIEQKTFYGRFLGFLPMGYLVAMYLVVPMIYLSVVQMGETMRGIRNF